MSRKVILLVSLLLVAIFILFVTGGYFLVPLPILSLILAIIKFLSNNKYVKKFLLFIVSEIQPPEIPPFKRIIEEKRKRREFPKEEHWNIVYMNERKVNELKEVLISKRILLLEGLPKSRKTTFILGFATYMEKNGYMVYYMKVKREESYNYLFERIRPYDKEKMIFIIDDCQNNPDDVGEFIREVIDKTKKARFILISRPISKISFKNKENCYFDFEDIFQIKWLEDSNELKEEILGVIKKYCLSKNIEYNEGKIGGIDELIQKIGRNFWLLNKFLEIWKDYPQFSLSEIPLGLVYEKIYEDYFLVGDGTEEKKRLFSSLCAIHQFDLLIPYSFLDSEGLGVFGTEYEKMLKSLIDEGLVSFDGTYYAINESPYFANTLLKVLEYKQKCIVTLGGVSRSREDFIVEIIKKLLVRTKNLQILQAIYENREEVGIEIGKKIMEDEEVVSIARECFSQIKSPVAVAMYLRILNKFRISHNWKEKILTEKVLERWAKNVPSYSPKGINSLIEAIGEFDTRRRKEILKMINIDDLILIYKNALSEAESRKVDIDAISDLKKLLGREVLEKVLSSVSTDEIKRIFYESEDKRVFNFFYNNPPCTFPKGHPLIRAWKEFLQEKIESYEGIKSLLEKLNSMDLIALAKFISLTYFHPHYKLLISQYLVSSTNVIKIRKATIGEMEICLHYLIPIRYKKDPLAGLKLANAILDLYLFDIPKVSSNSAETFLKAEELLLKNKISQQDISSFRVEGYHGSYLVKVKENIITCSCRGYEERGYCSHSIAVWLFIARGKNLKERMEKIIKISSLKEIQNLLRLVNEMRRRDLLGYIMEVLENLKLELRLKCSEASLKDINFFLWNLPKEYLSQYDKFIIENVDLNEKIISAKPPDILHFLWNLFEGDSLESDAIKNAVEHIMTSAKAGIGEKVALIGVLNFVDPNLLKHEYFNEIQPQIYNFEDDLLKWFIRCCSQAYKREHRYLGRGLFSSFLFLLGIVGLKWIDEKYCFEIINKVCSLILASNIERLISHINTECKIAKANMLISDKGEMLYREVIDLIKKEGIKRALN